LLENVKFQQRLELFVDLLHSAERLDDDSAVFPDVPVHQVEEVLDRIDPPKVAVFIRKPAEVDLPWLAHLIRIELKMLN